MSAGLRVWDEQSNLLIDSSTHLAALLGVVFITTDNPSGYIDDGYLNQGTPFYFLMAGSSGFYVPFNINISGTRLTWSPNGDTNTGYYNLAYVYYGIK